MSKRRQWIILSINLTIIFAFVLLHCTTFVLLYYCLYYNKTAIITYIQGMQNLSTPTEGNVVSTLSAWSPLFRYMDGGITENSAITHAIASMQKSCGDDDASNPKYDCTTQTVRLMSIHGTKKKIKRLFANCDCGTTDFPWIGTGMNSHIFLEDFPDPDDPGWTVYSNTTYSLLPDKRFLSFVESTFVDRDIEPSTSYAWRGPSPPWRIFRMVSRVDGTWTWFSSLWRFHRNYLSIQDTVRIIPLPIFIVISHKNNTNLHSNYLRH